MKKTSKPPIGSKPSPLSDLPLNSGSTRGPSINIGKRGATQNCLCFDQKWLRCQDTTHAKAGKIEGELAKNGKDREVPRTPTLRQVLQMLRDKDGVARKGVSFS